VVSKKPSMQTHVGSGNHVPLEHKSAGNLPNTSCSVHAPQKLSLLIRLTWTVCIRVAGVEEEVVYKETEGKREDLCIALQKFPDGNCPAVFVHISIVCTALLQLPYQSYT